MVALNWLTLGEDFFLYKQRFPIFTEIDARLLSQNMERLILKTGEVQNPSGAYLSEQVPFSTLPLNNSELLNTLKRYDPASLSEEAVEEILEGIRNSMEANDKQKPLLYYGVLDSGGIEALMSEELWNDDNHPAHKGNIRGGGSEFWLYWCKNGGRDGSSMPFSVWLCPEDFQYIRTNKRDGYKLLWHLRSLNILDTKQTIMSYLWPWSQHYQVIMERVQERIVDEQDGWDTDVEKIRGPIEIEIDEFANYARRNAQTRGPVEGFTYPRVRWNG
jgi:hypothetical protein